MLTTVVVTMVWDNSSERSHYQQQHLDFASFKTVFPHMQETRICRVIEFLRMSRFDCARVIYL